MSSYEEVIEKDLVLLRSIQDYCYRTPWLNDYMARIVSKNPLRDVVSVLWIFFVYGLVEIGPHHFWVVVMNLVGAFGKHAAAVPIATRCSAYRSYHCLVMRSLVEAKRPVEYDIRLQPLTDKSATSYG
jgi:hypothetical protein